VRSVEGFGSGALSTSGDVIGKEGSGIGGAGGSGVGGSRPGWRLNRFATNARFRRGLPDSSDRTVMYFLQLRRSAF
jgi:hypothetical protein